MTEPAGPRDPAPTAPDRTAPNMPGIGAITGLAFVVVLVPAIIVAVVLNVCGAALAVSCMLGLLIAFVGMAAYPRVLRKLGWLPTAPR
ncbi:MAG: hypothetical protein JWN96_3743 [Mycobacterium sp.]|nr:hypothetical protein [Mycobacterium sp.]